MNPTARARRIWSPLLVRAVPLRLVLDSREDLDALESTVLGLLRAAPRDQAELARKLHVPSSFASSALANLVDRDLAILDETTGFYHPTPLDAGLQLAAKPCPGWGFYTEALGLLPTVWVGGTLPRAEHPDGVVLEVRGERVRSRPRERLDHALQALLGAREVTVLSTTRQTGYSGPAALDGEPLPLVPHTASTARVRSAVLETGVGRPPGDIKAWIPVDLLPRMRGSAVIVVREPVISPSRQKDPSIRAQLATWLEKDEPAVWGAILDEALRMHIDMSLVLQRAGIDSEEKLEIALRRHAAEQARRVGLEALSGPPADDMLLERILDAQRWLVLAQREPAYRAQVRDAWAHAIEQLTTKLADLARPHLSRWKTSSQRPACPDKGEVAERLRTLGLEGRLGASETHLRRWAVDAGLPSRLDVAAVGAGASLTLWLLPLVLLSAEEALRYSRHVTVALEHHPGLFEDLAELVDLRDYTFHEGRTRGAERLASDLPEHMERCFVAAYAALHRGLANGAA